MLSSTLSISVKHIIALDLTRLLGNLVVRLQRNFKRDLNVRKKPNGMRKLLKTSTTALAFLLLSFSYTAKASIKSPQHSAPDFISTKVFPSKSRRN